MQPDSEHDNLPTSTGVDASLLTAQQAARAAAVAVDNLQNAERSTKPRHARRWRLAGFGALQDARLLVRRAMVELANAELADAPEGGDPAGNVARLDERTAVLELLARMEVQQGSLVLQALLADVRARVFAGEHLLVRGGR